MTKSWMIGAGSLGVVLGLIFGGLFAAAVTDDEQSVAVQSTDRGTSDAREPSATSPQGLLGGTIEDATAESPSPASTAATALPTATALPAATATPVQVLPGPTAVAQAPTATPTVPPPPPTNPPDPPALVNDSAPAAEPSIEIPADILSCTDNYVVLTRGAGNSQAELDALFDDLANNPNLRAANVTESCPSIGGSDRSAYVGYVGPFGNAVDACVTAANLGVNTTVVRLSTASAEPMVKCPAISGFVTHQGRFFVADVPQGSTMVDADLDVGYGFRTRYEGPGYFVTIETSRNDVAQTGASAKESAAGVAQVVPDASALRQVMVGGTEVWYFEYTHDGFYKFDLFFNLGVDGYAVIGADSSSTDVAFGLALHTVASLRPIG